LKKHQILDNKKSHTGYKTISRIHIYVQKKLSGYFSLAVASPTYWTLIISKSYYLLISALQFVEVMGVISLTIYEYKMLKISQFVIDWRINLIPIYYQRH